MDKKSYYRQCTSDEYNKLFRGGYMMLDKVGDRVGAILREENGTIEFFGYGIYEGDFVPQEAIGFMAKILREGDIPNPRIKLDEGGIVYGCECWWGSEEKVKTVLESKNIVFVKIDDYRKKYTDTAREVCYVR